MKSIINIATFFDNINDRTVEKLAKVYQDEELLYDSVALITANELSKEKVCGKKILLKPNFVRESRKPSDDICLITNPALIFATVRVLFDRGAQQIIIGDAPIQDCHWELMLKADFYGRIDQLQKHYGKTIKVVDFRKVIFDVGANSFGKSKRTEDDYLVFDTGERSWLEPITENINKFRVTNYDPRRMAQSHAKGKHQYCVAKEVFEADIVITMPKPKTHRMACLTNSLKILVGINGDKDYLPHHRIGSKSRGGDCYKDTSILRTWAEKLIDFSNYHRGAVYFRVVRKLVSILWKLSRPSQTTSMNAGWYGNDTVWRMVLDLNNIAIFGKIDGTIADTCQRTLYTICDGIIGGQRSGPLEPDPLPLGLLSFSNDPYFMDEVMGEIFSLDISRIPLLREAAKMNETKQKSFFINGKPVSYQDVRALRTSVELAPGWVDYKR